MSKLRIPVTLTSGINEPVVEASEVKDVSFNKNQSKINEDTSRAIGNINNLVVGEDNLVDAINVNSNSIVTLDETKANKVDVQTALGLKADKTDLNAYVNDASYDSNTKRINFKHNSTILAFIDATDFIKDGMVSNVTIENGYLIITFNTDSGQEPIRIALTDIFNPDNYYTKTAIDTKLGTLEFIVPGSNNVTDAINNAVRNINTAIGDLEEEKADKTAITALQNTKADKSYVDDVLANKANIDGSYDSMAVGIAKNLEGRKIVEDSFFERTTGGEAEVANGVAQLEEIQGNSVNYNQLVDTNTSSVATISGHKYFKIISGTSSIVTSTGSSIAVSSGDMVFDLTVIGIDDLTTVEAVEARLADNYGKLPYYPYSAGKILNNTFEGIESTGRNLLDPITNKARILGVYSEDYDAYYGITGTYGTLTFVSDNGETTTITPDSEGKFLIEESGYLTVANPSDCCVFLWWDGSKTDYVENDTQKAYLDIKNIWGKAQGSDTLVQVWPNGMPKVNDTPDVLTTENGETVAKKYIGSRAYASGDESDNSVITDGSTTTYYILSTPITLTNLVYKNSPYFADGTPVVLPMNYKVNNWGIERILPQNTSANVVTAKPTISCKYSIDAVEDLDTLHTQVDNLDEKKPNKEGIYDGMVVGAAKAIAGNQRVIKDSTSFIVDAATGIAKVNEVMGRSEKWNQLVQRDIVNWLFQGGTGSEQNGWLRNTYTNPASSSRFQQTLAQAVVVSHKYYFRCEVRSSVAADGYVVGDGGYNIVSQKSLPANTVVTFDSITSPAVASTILRIYTNSNATASAGDYAELNKNVKFCDLTDIYGEGNEPTTVEQFEADVFAKYGKTLDEYFGYDAGSINNANVEKLDITGFNQWDEEWEVGGYKVNTGVKTTGNWLINKNFIPLLPNTSYYCSIPRPSGATYDFRAFFYDAEKKFIKYEASLNNFTPPANARYLNFTAHLNYGTTYNHDICINISNPTKNGTYEPYRHVELPTNIKTATGKVNGEGESVTIFPNGMRGVGTAYDSLIVDEDGWARRVIVRMASRAYQEGDASDTSVLTDGTTTIYALATPIEYVLDEPILMTFNAYNGGVIRQVKGDMELATRINVTFAIDAVGILNGLPQNYISADSMDAFLARLSTAMGGTWTKTWDATTQKYNFTFVSNS